jgi:hypothetical protein
MTKRWLLPPLLLALVLAAGGCAKSDDAKVPSAGGTATAAPTPSLSLQEKAAKYGQCMREHGIPMEDPKVEGDRVQLSIPTGAPIDAAKQKAADEACKQYSPIGAGGAKPDSEQAQKLLKYAQCMRQNGVEKFPDPDGGLMRIGPEIANDPDFAKAQQACKDLVPGS